MKKFTAASIATAIGLSLLATAQDADKGEPDFAKVPAAPTPEEIATREAGIKTAWGNSLNAAHQIAASQGYRRRNTRWADTLPTEGFTIVPLQLYAGNTYYLCLGVDTPAENISASAFDPERRLIKSAPDSGNGKLVLKITPEKSGPHYLRLHHKNPAKVRSHYALTYIYK